MVSEISAVISTGSAASGRNAAVAFRFARAASRLQWSRAMTAPEPPRSQSPSRHVPVLLRQVIQYLAPHDDGVYVDGTYGAGGYSAALLAAADTRVIGIDRDPTAIAAGAVQVAAADGRLVLVAGRFGTLDEIVTVQGIASVDGAVLDLGVSSMQLDTPQRGFSFRQDGPLDMRMGGDGPSAADVVAAASERDLADIIFLLGEERHARAVARALAGIVARVVRGRPGDIHPATRTFQALRLFLNEELRELVEGLSAAERILKPGGRLVVVSFHSLEDRIVKTFFAARSGTGGGSRHLPEAVPVPATFNVLTRRPVIPDDAEVRDNPRARSAKLRAGERTAAPVATAPTPALSRLPTLADVMGR
jgi:16S rRNA (cytosine1402-N4)-methyltransferase